MTQIRLHRDGDRDIAFEGRLIGHGEVVRRGQLGERSQIVGESAEIKDILSVAWRGVTICTDCFVERLYSSEKERLLVALREVPG